MKDDFWVTNDDDDDYIFARKSLSEEDAQISAIWVIGNYGNEEAINKVEAYLPTLTKYVYSWKSRGNNI